MDASAIQTIVDLAITNNANKLGVIGATLVPKSADLKSVERFYEQPKRFRGAFSTDVMAEFIGYVNDNGTENTNVFIDAENMKAKAIIDMGDEDSPQWGEHIAKATLIKSPEYAALLQCNTQTFGQQELIDFAEDWEYCITFVDAAGNDMDFRKTLATLRRIKVNANATAEQTVGNFAAARSTLEQVEIKAGADELPEKFIFACKPYDGFVYQYFDCPLHAKNGEKGPQFKYRIVGLEAKRNEIADEFKNRIREAVTVDNVSIYLGTMSYQE